MLRSKKILWVILSLLIITQGSSAIETSLDNKMIEDVIKECEKLTFESRAAFPIIIKKFQEIGIERYYTDLIALEKTFYTKDEFYRDKITLQEPHIIEEVFSEEGVSNALKERQDGKLDYSTYLHKIMKAGVVCYIVFIRGEETHFIGRKGEVWIAHFPFKK